MESYSPLWNLISKIIVNELTKLDGLFLEASKIRNFTKDVKEENNVDPCGTVKNGWE